MYSAAPKDRRSYCARFSKCSATALPRVMAATTRMDRTVIGFLIFVGSVLASEVSANAAPQSR